MNKIDSHTSLLITRCHFALCASTISMIAFLIGAILTKDQPFESFNYDHYICLGGTFLFAISSAFIMGYLKALYNDAKQQKKFPFYRLYKERLNIMQKSI